MGGPRPGYPPAAVAWLAEHLRLGPGWCGGSWPPIRRQGAAPTCSCPTVSTACGANASDLPGDEGPVHLGMGVAAEEPLPRRQALDGVGLLARPVGELALEEVLPGRLVLVD